MASTPQNERDRLLAEIEAARAAMPPQITAEQLEEAAKERFKELWDMLAEYNAAVVKASGPGAAISHRIEKVDMKDFMVDGFIEYSKPGASSKRVPFSIQGKGIWFESFP